MLAFTRKEYPPSTTFHSIDATAQAPLMDSRRISDGINHYLSTMARLEGRALCASKTLYNMDAVAKAP